MGYQALLFCPEEKTARTVTQVLGELEFAVETCAEPFAAVKKLMGEHFDAIVVDCDNEQNATLLFKSARNSTSNQASLAVAVVEGQAGVAKAFRIGANLVLTKPINVEQAKGTLRVARGLLRKGEPVKPAAAPPAPVAAAAPAATPAKPVPPKPVLPPRPAAPIAAAPAAPVVKAPVVPPAPPAVKPAVLSVPSQAVEASRPNAMDEDLLELNVPEPAKPAASIPVAPATPKLPPVSLLEAAESRPATKAAPPAPSSSSGAASAPAPARETQAPAVTQTETKHPANDLFEKPAAVESSSAASHTPAPAFTFGGANAPAEPTGGNKKIFIGIAAAAIVAVGAYFTWSHFQRGSAHQPSAPVAVSTPEPAKPSAPAAPSSNTNAKPAAEPIINQQPTEPIAHAAAPSVKPVEEEDSVPEKTPSSKSAKSNGGTKSAESSSAPLMVKGGATPASHKAAPAPDTPAPSLIGMAAPASAPPPDLVSGITTPKPVLQTLNISQGVSSGLLIKKVQPVYPQNALTMHVEGVVELIATISKSGAISSVKVLSGPALLTRPATDAVKQWKYKPYLLNGEPVEIQTQITINFKLPH